MSRLQLGPEGPSVHPFPKVALLRDYARRVFLSKELLSQEVLFEHEFGTVDILLFTDRLDWSSCKIQHISEHWGIVQIQYSFTSYLTYMEWF